MITDPGGLSASQNAATPHTNPPDEWRTRPGSPLAWRRVTSAMEQRGAAASDPFLFDLSQWLDTIVADHNAPGGEGCEGCEADTRDRCPTWRQAQDMLIAWLLGRR
jgi:hypothetical protein